MAFHTFLQCEQDQATQKIAKSGKAVTFEASTDSEQPHHDQARLAQKKSHDSYIANNGDHHDNVASPIGEYISDVDFWDPPPLPA